MELFKEGQDVKARTFSELPYTQNKLDRFHLGRQNPSGLLQNAEILTCLLSIEGLMEYKETPILAGHLQTFISRLVLASSSVKDQIAQLNAPFLVLF